MTINELRVVANALCRDFKVKIERLEELPNHVKRWGDCDDDKVVRIRLKRKNRSDDLSDRFVVETLCHELAHCVVWDHGWKHRCVTALMIKRAKELGFID